jgi:hypothetical protein
MSITFGRFRKGIFLNVQHLPDIQESKGKIENMLTVATILVTMSFKRLRGTVPFKTLVESS